MGVKLANIELLERISELANIKNKLDVCVHTHTHVYLHAGPQDDSMIAASVFFLNQKHLLNISLFVTRLRMIQISSAYTSFQPLLWPL